MLGDDLQNVLFHHLSRDGGEADWLVVPWIPLLLASFEDESNIGFPLGPVPVFCDFSTMVESGLATASASSLSTCECISSGPVNLCVLEVCTVDL